MVEASRAIPDLRRALAIVAGSGALIALVALGLEVVAYEGTRARWRAISERVEAERVGDGAAYDPGASDALYAQVRARRSDARRNAWLVGALVIVAASCAGRRTSRSAHDAPRSEVSRPSAVLKASVLDVMIGAAGLAVAIAAGRSSTSIAASDALAIVMPALVVAALVAAAARGATPGQRAFGLALAPPPGPARALLVVALLPVAAVWLVVAGVPLAIAIATARAPSAALLAPHLALCGLASEDLPRS